MILRSQCLTWLYKIDSEQLQLVLWRKLRPAACAIATTAADHLPCSCWIVNLQLQSTIYYKLVTFRECFGPCVCNSA